MSTNIPGYSSTSTDGMYWKTQNHSSVCYQAFRLWQHFAAFLALLMLYLALSPAPATAAAAPAVEASLGTNYALIDNRNLQFSQITEREGLSQATINAIAQDNSGYLWLGTQEGLNRYDGYELLVFEHYQNDPVSLSHDWIWSLYVDQAGTLWAGTDGGGLNRFDPETKSFTHYRHNDEIPESLGNDKVRVIFQDKSGSYWIGTDGGGLDHFDADSGTFTHYRHNETDTNSLPGNRVRAITEDANGNLWIGTDNGLARMDRKRLKFERYQHDASNSNSLSDNDVRKIYEDRQGRLWVGTYAGGINLLDRNSSQFRRFQHNPEDPQSLSHNNVRDIYQDHEGTLWIATDGGLNELRSESGLFVHYSHNPLDATSITDDRTTALYQDRGDVLWVGTYNGLNKWNYVSDAFTYLGADEGNGPVLSGNVITTLSEGSGNSLWVGVYGGGINRVDLKNAQVDYFRHDENDPQSLSDDRVMSLFAEHNGGIWAGTRRSGLSYRDPESGKFTHYRHNPDDKHSLSANAVTTILKDRQGVLWVGTYGGGLNRFDPDTNNFRAYQHDPNNTSSISSNRILTLFQDRSDTLWIGTEDGGLNRFDAARNAFIHYQHDPELASSLSSNVAWHITESHDGSLWIATLGGGLNRWLLADRKAGNPLFRRYQKSDGLKSNTVYGTLEDRHGFLWLSSNRGLSKFDPGSGTVKHYDRFNGLRSNEFNSGAYLKTNSGQLYFGGANGVLTFDPNVLNENQHEPELVLSAYTKDDQLTTVSSTDDVLSEPLVFDHDNDFVEFRFTALDFSSPHLNQYRYKLEGFDDDWNPVQSSRTATYASLPSGDYVFMVSASNSDGIWNEAGVSIPFVVKPAPWLTLGAYFGYMLLIGGVLFAYKVKENRKHQQTLEYSAQLEAEVAARTQELSDRNAQLHDLNEKLQEMSYTDALTGLHNRRYLYESIEPRVAALNRRVEDTRKGSIKSAKIDISPSMFFMMIDLDGFKVINDNYGHTAGDRVLVQVRDVLRDSSRKSDIIVRWGGDEFLIVGEAPSIHAAEQLAERIRKNLAEHQYRIGEGHMAKLSGSIGFAMYPFSPFTEPDLLSWEQVVGISDHAAYTAKNNGRDAWVGVYGTPSSTWKEFTRTNINLVELADSGMLTIGTSLGSMEESVLQPSIKSRDS